VSARDIIRTLHGKLQSRRGWSDQGSPQGFPAGEASLSHQATAFLRRNGLEVTPSEVPGLYRAAGHPALATNHVLDLAMQKGWKPNISAAIRSREARTLSQETDHDRKA
jgi:hypothetical protein